MDFSLPKLVLALVAFIGLSNRPIRPEESYVDQFKYMAISEMKRTGIPASIKLAQGLTESMSGRSELALNANNHFGIKCKGDWDGETYQYKDDDINVNGELIHSCFRKYSSPEFSYIDHSDFLVHRTRYKMLFSYDKTDFRSWANGLKACGYATDPTYAEKLIEIINRLDLYNLDVIESPEIDLFPFVKVDNITEQPTKVVISETEQTIKSINTESVQINASHPVKKKKGHSKHSHRKTKRLR